MASTMEDFLTACYFFTSSPPISAVMTPIMATNDRLVSVVCRQAEDNQRSQVHPARIIGYVDTVVTLYDEIDFKQHFRMKRATLEHVTCRIANFVPQRVHNIRTKVLHFLWLLGNTETFRSVADRFNISKSTLRRNVGHVAEALLLLRDEEIKFPITEEERRRVASQFLIPGTIGCIDGSYIPMTGKRGDKRDAYICRKGFPAMHIQVVCDKNLLITDAVVGYPGSVHDARVYRNCPLLQILKDLPPNYHLLGDSAYPLNTYLVTKYRDNRGVILTNDQKRFNSKHASERSCVERCIGLLKGKFRRLKQFQSRDDSLMCKAIVSCVVLHNIILKAEGVIEEDISLTFDDTHPEQMTSPQCPTAIDKRNELCMLL